MLRLNISHKHIEDEIAFQNLVNHVKWAKDAGIYLIIGYFVPPGSLPSQGYYDEKPFWDEIRNPDGSLNVSSPKLNAYWAHWEKISNQLKDETHVLFELLNEPQLLTKWENYGVESDRYVNYISLLPITSDEKIYLNLIKSTIDRIRSVGASQVIVVDGLNYDASCLS